MKQRTKFSQGQRLAILNDYVASDLTAREYATLKNVGYSTLAGWAAQEGISLKKKIVSNPQSKISLKGNSATFNADPNYKRSTGFSFIDITGYTKDNTSSSPPINFHPTDGGLLGRKYPPPSCDRG